MTNWGTRKEIETWRRCKLALWAYAYEFENHSIVPDSVYDVESYQVDLNINTDRPDLDAWFRANFQPHTGMWVRNHPDLPVLQRLYREYGKC